jgi:hypothetical protein
MFLRVHRSVTPLVVATLAVVLVDRPATQTRAFVCGAENPRHGIRNGRGPALFGRLAAPLFGWPR